MKERALWIGAVAGLFVLVGWFVSGSPFLLYPAMSAASEAASRELGRGPHDPALADGFTALGPGCSLLKPSGYRAWNSEGKAQALITLTLDCKGAYPNACLLETRTNGRWKATAVATGRCDDVKDPRFLPPAP